MTFEEGQRVILVEDEDEGWPREEGVVLGRSGNRVWLVEVDEEYRYGPEDDGLREVLEDHMIEDLR